jgi:hypothetical protein
LPSAGEIHKIKADTLYLLSAFVADARVLAFTDSAMLSHFEKDRMAGRFPSDAEVQLRLFHLPASAEVSPRRE